MATPAIPGKTPAQRTPTVAATEPSGRVTRHRASAPGATVARRFPLGFATRTRELVLWIVGIATPIGILGVNGAAFVMSHLAAFRVVIAACALVSSLLLNGISALWVLRSVEAGFTSLFSEYRRWLVALGVLIVLATSGFAAYFTYVGMQDPKHLPNRVAVITAILALGVPFALTWIGRRVATRRRTPETA